MNVRKDLNHLHMISDGLQLNAFQSARSPVSALGITFSVSLKSPPSDTIREG